MNTEEINEEVVLQVEIAWLETEVTIVAGRINEARAHMDWLVQQRTMREKQLCELRSGEESRKRTAQRSEAE